MFTTKNLLILSIRNAFISLVVMSVAAIIIFILSNEIGRMSDSVALNNHLKAELDKRIGLFEELKHDTQIIGTNDVKIGNAFVPSDNILEFVSILDSLAIKNTLTETYHFETPVSSTISAPFPISTISYSNNFGTNILSFSNYLKDFNALPYLTKIEGFTITSNDPLGWLGASNISLRATLYTNATQ